MNDEHQAQLRQRVEQHRRRLVEVDTMLDDEYRLSFEALVSSDTRSVTQGVGVLRPIPVDWHELFAAERLERD